MSQVEKIKRLKLSKSLPKSLPERAGVYIFWQGSTPIYIGKSTNLKSRVSSYFSVRLLPKTRAMVAEAESLSYVVVGSEIEALLLEAKLIRGYMPRYNIIAKDDKHPLYIAITDEDYPRVITVRKKVAQGFKKYYGPFPSGRNVREVLRLIRKIIPFSDHTPTRRKCIYAHMGLCSPCPSEIAITENSDLKAKLTTEYKRNIRSVTSLLNGNIAAVKNTLFRQMKKYSVSQEYEMAGLVKRKLERLVYITSPATPIEGFLENPNLTEDVRLGEVLHLQKVLGESGINLTKLNRIECYDVAHIQGSNKTASMVTFVGGEASREFYRHFKIKKVVGISDTDSLKEVAERRVKHLTTWGRPDLIVVDGGKGQVSAFKSVFDKLGIPVVGIAKREEVLVVPVTVGYKLVRLKGESLNLVQRMRDEAHRFARRYHHKLVSDILKNS